jgi:hypothetical protein
VGEALLGRPAGRIPGVAAALWTISIHSEDAALTERVLSGWDEHLTHRSLPRTATVSVIGAFVAGRESIGEDDAARWVAEQRELGERGERGEFYFAVSQLCFAATKPM